jgi:DNA-binding transcriptional LysR family regulator
MINSLHLKHFYFSAKFKSHRRAAQFSGVSQPAVSQSVRRLEEDLDTLLMVRTNRVCHLTVHGQRLFDFAEKFWKDSQELRESMRQKDPEDLILKIGINKHYDSYCLPILKGFLKAHPEIVTEFRFGDGEEIRKGFLEGDFDIAFVINFDRLENPAYSLDENSIYLLEDKIRVCCDPSHPILEKKRLGLREISDYRFFLPSFYVEPIQEQFAASHLKLKVQTIMNNGKIVAKLLVDTPYLGILSYKTIPEEDRDRLAFLDTGILDRDFILVARVSSFNDLGNPKGRQVFTDYLETNKDKLFQS